MQKEKSPETSTYEDEGLVQSEVSRLCVKVDEIFDSIDRYKGQTHTSSIGDIDLPNGTNLQLFRHEKIEDRSRVYTLISYANKEATQESVITEYVWSMHKNSIETSVCDKDSDDWRSDPDKKFNIEDYELVSKWLDEFIERQVL